MDKLNHASHLVAIIVLMHSKGSINQELKEEILKATNSSCTPHVDRKTLFAWNYYPRFFPCWLLSADDSMPSFPFTLGLIGVPFLLSVIAELPLFQEIYNNESLAPYSFNFNPQKFYGYLGIFSVAIATICIFLMFVVTFMDPGVLLPVWPVQIRQQVPRKAQKNSITVPATGKVVFSKWCWTCGIWRPIRSVHCDACKNCVRRFDHHCPWISKCVGLRNHFIFLIWVYTASVTNFTFVVVHLMNIVAIYSLGQTTMSDFLLYRWPSYLLPLFQLPFLLFTTYLSGYHTYLGLTNQTTNERYKALDRPYSRGYWANFKQFMGGCLEPSVLYCKDPNARLGGEDIELTTTVLNQLRVQDAFGQPVDFKTGIASNCFLLPSDIADILDEREAAYRRGHDTRMTLESIRKEKELAATSPNARVQASVQQYRQNSPSPQRYNPPSNYNQQGNQINFASPQRHIQQQPPQQQSNYYQRNGPVYTQQQQASYYQQPAYQQQPQGYAQQGGMPYIYKANGQAAPGNYAQPQPVSYAYQKSSYTGPQGHMVVQNLG